VQDNGAGAPLHFAVTYRQLDMVGVMPGGGGDGGCGGRRECIVEGALMVGAPSKSGSYAYVQQQARPHDDL
jgi:hypothetical protein